MISPFQALLKKSVLGFSFLKYSTLIFFLGLLLAPKAGLQAKEKGPRFTVDVAERTRVKKKHGQTLNHIIGVNSEGIYMMRTRMISYVYYIRFVKVIAKMDPETAQILWGKPLFDKNYSSKGKVISYVGPIMVQGKLVVFPQVFDKKGGNSYLFYQELDEFAEPTGPPVQLSREKVKNKRSSPNYALAFSMDSNMVALSIGVPGENKKREYSYLVFNRKEGTIVANYEPTFEGDVEDFSLEDFEVTNEGNLMLAYGFINEGTKKRKADDSWEFFLSYYTPENPNAPASETEVEITGRYVSGLNLKQSNNYIACSGFYGKKSSYNVTGAFHQLFDLKEMAFVSQTNQDFPAALIRQFDTTKKKRKTKGEKAEELGVPRVHIREILLTKEGKTILIGEDYFSRLNCVTNSNGSQTCYMTYYYGDLLVTTIDQVGQIESTQRVVKYMSSRDAYFYKGYTSMLHANGTLSLFFYADAKDLKKTSDGEAVTSGNPRKGYMKVLNILPGGDMEADVVLDYKEHKKMYITPDGMEQIDKETILFFYSKGGMFNKNKQGIGYIRLAS